MVSVSYICMGVYPFGDEGIIIVDSYHQYVPFFSEFRDKVMSGNSLCIPGTEGWAIILGFDGLLSGESVEYFYSDIS